MSGGFGGEWWIVGTIGRLFAGCAGWVAVEDCFACVFAWGAEHRMESRGGRSGVWGLASVVVVAVVVVVVVVGSEEHTVAGRAEGVWAAVQETVVEVGTSCSVLDAVSLDVLVVCGRIAEHNLVVQSLIVASCCCAVAYIASHWVVVAYCRYCMMDVVAEQIDQGCEIVVVTEVVRHIVPLVVVRK